MKREYIVSGSSDPRSLIGARVLSARDSLVNISEDITPSVHSVPFKPLWHLPNPLRSFSGRKLQLSRLDKAFQNKQQHLVIQDSQQIRGAQGVSKAPQKITGTGGIGKTQLAVQFAHNMVQQGRFKNVIWLNADTSSDSRLRNEFNVLANALNINLNQSDFSLIITAVYQKLSLLGNTLIVFDSAVSHEALKDYLPPKDSPISILVTTRDNNPWADQFEQLPLDIFTLEEALEFIRKVVSPQQYNVEQATALADMVGRFPLALAQATGYIVTRNISIQQYRGIYQEKQQNQKALLDKKPLQADPHQETIWVTVNLCIEQITSSLTLSLLHVASNLAPETPIEVDLLCCWGTDEKVCLQAIKELQNYSLLEEGNANNQVKIHQMVQDIVFLIRSLSQEAYQAQVLDTAERVDNFFVAKVEPNVAYQRHINLLPHIRKLIARMDGCNRNNATEADRQNYITASLETASGNVYETIGDYVAEKKSYHRALSVTELYPDSVLKTSLLARLYNNLSNAYGNVGDVATKIGYLQEAMRLNGELHGTASNDDLLVLKSNLANAYGQQGEYRKKIQMLEEVLIVKQGSVIANEYELAIVLDNLGSAYLELRDYVNAEKLISQSLSLFTKIYGRSHPETATRLSNLASVYSYTNRSDLAISMLNEAKAILEKHFGKQHITVARTLNALAFAYGDKGDQQKRITALREVLNVKTEFFGQEHPDTAKARCNLADCLRVNGMQDEAIRHFDQALPIIQKYYSSDNIVRIRTMFDYALCLNAKGERSLAEKVFLEALSAGEKSLGANSPYLTRFFKTIGAFYAYSNQFDKAIKYLERGVQIWIHNFGEDHPDTAIAKMELASTFISSQQDLPRAKQLVQAAQTVLRNFRHDPRYLGAFNGTVQAAAIIDSLMSLNPSASVMVTSTVSNKIDTSVLDRLLKLTRIDSLDDIYLLIEESMRFQHYKLALTLIVELRIHRQMTLRILELETQCCLYINDVKSAMEHIQAAYEFGGSDKVSLMLEQATKALEQQSSAVNEKESYMAKWQCNSIAPNEIIYLAVRCIRLGEYQEALKFLEHRSLIQGSVDIQAAASFQRAKCAFMLGQINNALMFINESLILKKAELAIALRDQINLAAQYYQKLFEVAKKIDWELLPECDSEVGRRLQGHW